MRRLLYRLFSTCCFGAVPPAFFHTAPASASILGLNSQGSRNDLTAAADRLIGCRVQATASGTLQNAYVYCNNSGASTFKVLVYNSSSTDPQNTDALVAASASITSSGAGWAGPGAFSSGSIVSGNYYFVYFAVSATTANDVNYSVNETGTIWSQTSSGFYASPPAFLTNGAQNSFANASPVSIYCTVQ